MSCGVIAWSKKTVAIEMNHMIRLFCDPDISFPSDIWRKLTECGPVKECSY